MKTYSKITQWIVTGILSIWGVLSFLILAGEETPNDPMPIGQFFLLKGIAIVSLYLCYLTGKWLYGKGLVIEIKDDEV